MLSIVRPDAIAPVPECGALCCCLHGVCCPPGSPAWQRAVRRHLASKWCCNGEEDTILSTMPQFTLIAQNLALDSRYGFAARAIVAVAHTDVQLANPGYVAQLLSNWDDSRFPPEHYANLATNLVSDPVIVLAPKALTDAISATFRPIVVKLHHTNTEVAF